MCVIGGVAKIKIMEFNESTHLATNLRFMAAMFWEDAKKLDKEIERDENGLPLKYTAIPYYYLISHATELLLKVALLKRGFTREDLRKVQYGHNLENLIEELVKLNLPISDITMKMVLGLSEQHKDHSLRYEVLMDNGKKTFTPPNGWVNEMLTELMLLTRISTHGK